MSCISDYTVQSSHVQSKQQQAADINHPSTENMVIMNECIPYLYIFNSISTIFSAQQHMLSVLYAIARPSGVCLSVCHSGGSVENG